MVGDSKETYLQFLNYVIDCLQNKFVRIYLEYFIGCCSVNDQFTQPSWRLRKEPENSGLKNRGVQNLNIVPYRVYVNDMICNLVAKIYVVACTVYTWRQNLWVSVSLINFSFNLMKMSTTGDYYREWPVKHAQLPTICNTQLM